MLAGRQAGREWDSDSDHRLRFQGRGWRAKVWNIINNMTRSRWRLAGIVNTNRGICGSHITSLRPCNLTERLWKSSHLSIHPCLSLCSHTLDQTLKADVHMKHLQSVAQMIQSGKSSPNTKSRLNNTIFEYLDIL